MRLRTRRKATTRVVASVALCLAPGAASLAVAAAAPAHAAILQIALRGASVRTFGVGDYSSPSFRQSLTLLKADGASVVDLVVAVQQAKPTSVTMFAECTTKAQLAKHDCETPTADALGAGIRSAKSLGLTPMVTFHDDLPNAWRATIAPRPKDVDAWFASYQFNLLKYARIAQKNGGKVMSLGEEMSGVTQGKANGAHWTVMIRAVHKIFKGKLTYGAQYGGIREDINKVTFWPHLDYVGVSGYQPLSLTATLNPKKAEAMLEHWYDTSVAPVLHSTHKPLLITEVGYQSRPQGFKTPYTYVGPGPVDQQSQALAYSVFLAFAARHKFAGVLFWEWRPVPTTGAFDASDYTPQNKLAEGVLRHAWGRTADLTVYWPDTTTTIGGTQKFEALLPGWPVDSYTLTYRIDGAAPVAMADSTTATGQPEKAATADLSSVPVGLHSITLEASDSVGAPLDSSTTPLHVGAAPTPTMAQCPAAVVQAWWPTDTSPPLSGLQPFKAAADGLDVSTYNVTWNVDGGPEHAMTEQTTAADNNVPHYYADVDVDVFGAPGSAHTITYTATCDSGAVVGRTASDVTLAASAAGPTTHPTTTPTPTMSPNPTMSPTTSMTPTDTPSTSTSTTAAPTCGTATVEAWWPKSTSPPLQGDQPFKSAADGLDVSTYSITWSVDGGPENAMTDQTTAEDNNIPHKYVDVDVDGFGAPGSAHVVTYTATCDSGTPIGQATADITLATSGT